MGEQRNSGSQKVAILSAEGFVLLKSIEAFE